MNTENTNSDWIDPKLMIRMLIVAYCYGKSDPLELPIGNVSPKFYQL